MVFLSQMGLFCEEVYGDGKDCILFPKLNSEYYKFEEKNWAF